MAEMFAVTAETGYSINTVNVDTDGQNIVEFAADLKGVLDEFDEVMTSLTNQGMTGYMSDEALKSYQSVKDSLADYAARLSNTGNAVIQSAENISNASRQAGDSISVLN